MRMTDVREEGPFSSFEDPIAALRIALRGRYEFERQIGQGAFATVFLARDLKHERRVAIKVLNADPTSETGEIRFIREIRLVARLQHPNILPLHDSGHVEALLYYVMPFVEGETLRVRMHRERQMAVEAACTIARETADALAYAHKQGIVHRDIKPENILLSGGHAVVADFGIARAIDVGGVRQLTATGVAGPGTPAYMSPEQLLGDRAIDARSDIYSLGCVLHEMLVGKPPFSGKDGFVKRFTEPPPHLSSMRRDSPRWLDAVVAKALSKDPADRYATAADLEEALHPPVATTRTPARDTPLKNALASPPLFEADPLEAHELAAAFPDSYPSGGGRPAVRADSTYRSVPQRWLSAVRAHPLRSALSVLAVLAIGGAVAAVSNAGSLPAMFAAVPTLDSTRFVVLSSMRSAAGGGIGGQVADSLYDALTKWEGLPVVPDTRVAQAIADGAESPATEGRAIALARRVGAGRAVWVQASGNPRAPRVRIHLYDARSAESLDEFGVPAPRNEEYYAGVAQRLLGMGDRPRAALGCDGRTRSFRAWSACSRGHMSIAEWNVAAAERSFREAVSAQANFAPAKLWLAQLITWRGPERRSEAQELLRDLGGSESLSPRDQLVANGLTAFLEQRFPAACAAYRELTKRDSLDFVGWYGLGECQFNDSTVVRAPSSPSAWAFRSSWHSALDAYTRALRVQPGAHEIFPASRLQTLMPVSSTVARTGIGDSPGRPRYRAYATLSPDDTVGFVPYPAATFGLLQRPASSDAALRRNTALLDAFTLRWVERFPRSFRAQEARADALEARLELGEGPPRASAALRALDSALSLVSQAPDDGVKAVDLMRLRARKVRIHFKRGEFATARSVADSLFANPATPGTERELQWVAALTGRADLVAAYWERTLRTQALTGGTVPPKVALPASRYFSYAALGVCGPELLASAEQLDSAVRNYITPDIRDAVRSDLGDRAASLATPCTGGKSALSIPATSDKLWLAQQAFARGDVARVRALLAATAAERRGRRPGDTSVDYVFHDAWLRAQVGDTSAAVIALDAALGALPTFSSTTIRDPAAAASFGRVMALRVEIAAKRGDAVVARRWGTALGDLWRSADPALRGVVNEIRSLGAGATR